jgi:hypothetical protein
MIGERKRKRKRKRKRTACVELTGFDTACLRCLTDSVVRAIESKLLAHCRTRFFNRRCRSYLRRLIPSVLHL